MSPMNTQGLGKMQRKAQSGLLIIVILGVVAALAAGGVFSSVPMFSSIPTGLNGCTWAADYGWVQCCPDTSASGTYQVPVQIFSTFVCPTSTTVQQCKVINAGRMCYGGPQINGQPAQSGQIFGRGSTFIAGGCDAAMIEVDGQILIRSGLAGSCQGSQAEGAQGCSWKPPAGQLWADGTSGVKSIPFGSGNSQQYVISQHLLSCPSTCTPMSCATPSNLQSTVITYMDGQQHPAYVSCLGSSCNLNVIGCKPSGQICSNYSADGTTCLGYQASSQCGTIGTQSAGQCAQNSDCGSNGNYQCVVTNNVGVCVPFQNGQQDCVTSYDCTQSGQSCQNKQLSGVSLSLIHI